jgi:hypothetical protein
MNVFTMLSSEQRCRILSSIQHNSAKKTSESGHLNSHYSFKKLSLSSVLNSDCIKVPGTHIYEIGGQFVFVFTVYIYVLRKQICREIIMSSPFASSSSSPSSSMSSSFWSEQQQHQLAPASNDCDYQDTCAPLPLTSSNIDEFDDMSSIPQVVACKFQQFGCPAVRLCLLVLSCVVLSCVCVCVACFHCSSCTEYLALSSI